MDTISIEFIFLTLFFLGLFLYWVFNFTIIYHLIRFGIGIQPKKFVAVFLFGSVALFFVTIFIFANIDVGGIFNLILQ